MPQFLQTLLGYTSELAGFALSAGGLVLLFEMPIMGQLTTKFQARYLIAFGWLALSIAMFYSTKRIDLQISFNAATWLRITQVIGLGFLFVPITLVAYIGISPEKNNSVAGIVNFMRNMGSSVGTSLVTTLIARRSQFHQARLVENVRVDNPNFVNAANGLSSALRYRRRGQATRRTCRLMPEFTSRCRRRRQAWHTSIPLWFFPWGRRSCSFWLLF